MFTSVSAQYKYKYKKKYKYKYKHKKKYKYFKSGFQGKLIGSHSCVGGLFKKGIFQAGSFLNATVL